MAARVTIGEFSTMTRLTRKALRFYHDLGVLEPAEIDPSSGYRFYDVSQIERARTIRRFRDLDMPVAGIKAYVAAPDDAARLDILSAHLGELEAQLRRTGDAVASLRAIVETVRPPDIDVRDEPAFVAVAVTASVTLQSVAAWWNAAREKLDTWLSIAGVQAIGPLGADFEQRLFADEEGIAWLWYPIDASDRAACGPLTVEFPTARFAVALHNGPDSRIDETYSALGSYAAENGTGTEGSVRERYLAGTNFEEDLFTEIWWPVLPAL